MGFPCLAPAFFPSSFILRFRPCRLLKEAKLFCLREDELRENGFCLLFLRYRHRDKVFLLYELMSLWREQKLSLLDCCFVVQSNSMKVEKGINYKHPPRWVSLRMNDGALLYLKSFGFYSDPCCGLRLWESGI